jgi:hypothetical protein
MSKYKEDKRFQGSEKKDVRRRISILQENENNC